MGNEKKRSVFFRDAAASSSQQMTVICDEAVRVNSIQPIFGDGEKGLISLISGKRRRKELQGFHIHHSSRPYLRLTLISR